MQVPTLKKHDRILFRCRVYVSSSVLTPDIEQAYTVRHATDLHMHGSCMHVAVRVLHFCAFIYEVINAGSLCMQAG